MKLIEFLSNLFGKIQIMFSIPLGTFSKPNDKIELPILPAAPPPTASGDPLPPLVPAFSAPKKPDDVFHAYILKMFPIAEAIETSHGIHPLILLTQSAHESGWGLSDLAKDDNNLFGMTAGSWYTQRRPIVWYPTDEQSDLPPEKIKYWEFPEDIIWKKPDGKGGSLLRVKRPFRRYESWLASTQDWSNKISLGDPYRSAYEYARKGDLPGFAAALQRAGYATDKRYAEKLLPVGQKVTSVLKEISHV